MEENNEKEGKHEPENMGEITHVTVIISDLLLKTHFQMPCTLADVQQPSKRKYTILKGHCENENVYIRIFCSSLCYY